MNKRYVIHKPPFNRFHSIDGHMRDIYVGMSERLWDEIDGRVYTEMPGLTDGIGIKIMHKNVFYKIPFEFVEELN